jgi:hypothetical protein
VAVAVAVAVAVTMAVAVAEVQYCRIAVGSASELRSHLAVAAAWGDLEGSAAAAPALGLLDRILAILWRLTHS